MSENYVYVGREKCGCVSVIISDCGDQFTADSVADAIKTGRTIERVSFEDYRSRVCKEATFMDCPHEKQEQGRLVA